MSYSYRLIALFNLGLGFLSSTAHAYELFADALYWRSTETIDWAYVNDRHLPDQHITYRTINFPFEPNFRIGINSEKNVNFSFYYTKFHTHANDAVFGNATSAFIADRIANFPDGYLYQAGEIDFTIDYNMFDIDLSQSFCIDETLTFSPIIGLRGGWINQSISTDFQGPVSALERVKNNFIGLGPKTSFETHVGLFRAQTYQLDFFVNFTGAYLWGHWKIKDTYLDTTPKTVNVILDSKNFGALVLEGSLGFKFHYKNFSLKFAYEIIDWFNQCQIYDNDSGPNNEDLLLQGFTFGLLGSFS